MSTPQHKDLRFNDVSAKTRIKMCAKLNVKRVSGDFNTLAAELNMLPDEISTISATANHTEEIFKWWEPKKEATVKNLLKILKTMERYDVIDILNDDPNVKALADAENDNAQNTDVPSNEEVVDGPTALAHPRNGNVPSTVQVVDGLTAVGVSHTPPPSPPPPIIEVMELSDMNPTPISWQRATENETDVLLIAVNDNEFRPVYEILPEPEVADCGTNLTEAYFATIGENRVALVRSGQGAGGKTGIQATLTDALNELKPKVVIGVGMCYGMEKGKQKCADVIVSKKLATYGQCRVNSDGSVFKRGVEIECDARLVKLFSNKMGWKGPRPEQIKPDVKSGLIISGPELVDNKDRKEQLKKIYPEAVGGEMEGEGLYNICENLNVPWIVVKAICDWADGTKDKKWQLCAGAVAASLVKHVLTKNYIPEYKKRKSDGQTDQEPSPKKPRASTHM